MMTATYHATLFDELNRLLDLGEPLLTLYQRQHPAYWALVLPDNISPEMRCYADEVSLRAWGPEEYPDYRQKHSSVSVGELVEKSKAGLLGWALSGCCHKA